MTEEHSEDASEPVVLQFPIKEPSLDDLLGRVTQLEQRVIGHELLIQRMLQALQIAHDMWETLDERTRHLDDALATSQQLLKNINKRQRKYGDLQMPAGGDPEPSPAGLWLPPQPA